MVWLWDEAVWDWEARALRRRPAARGYRGPRRTRRRRALARLPGDRHRRPQPVRLVRRAGAARSWSTSCTRATSASILDYNPWDVGTRRAGASDAAMLAGLVKDLGVDGVFLDTLKEGDPELLDDARRAGARGRVAGAAGAGARPPGLVGAVVRRQRGAGRAAGALVRAAAHDAPHPPVGPRPRRRAALGLAQRGRRADLGRRLRRPRRLVRRRRGMLRAMRRGLPRARRPLRPRRVGAADRPAPGGHGGRRRRLSPGGWTGRPSTPRSTRPTVDYDGPLLAEPDVPCWAMARCRRAASPALYVDGWVRRSTRFSEGRSLAGRSSHPAPPRRAARACCRRADAKARSRWRPAGTSCR